ncbi:hypothetical protein HPSD74_2168 [Glaesserella parasuis D74]|nr:hypothetical protein HPSD74_2168 [Glaesserella parasuis D74]
MFLQLFLILYPLAIDVFFLISASQLPPYEIDASVPAY